MKRSATFWILSLTAFALFYVLFGGVTVEGYESAPVGFVILDVVTWLLTLGAVAGAASLVLAIFLMRSQRYFARVIELFPIVLFASTLLLLLGRIAIGGAGPVK